MVFTDDMIAITFFRSFSRYYCHYCLLSDYAILRHIAFAIIRYFRCFRFHFRFHYFSYPLLYIRYYAAAALLMPRISPPLIIITAYLLPLIISFHACRHYAIISPRHARYARLQVDTIELILFSHYFRLTLYFHYYAIFIFSHFSPFSLIIFAHFH
jgi:hypothetical protein